MRVRAASAARREVDRKRAVAARRARGALPRDVWLAEVQARRVAAATLRRLASPSTRSPVAYPPASAPSSDGSRKSTPWYALRQVRPPYQTLSALESRKPRPSFRASILPPPSIVAKGPRGGLPLAKPMGRTR